MNCKGWTGFKRVEGSLFNVRNMANFSILGQFSQNCSIFSFVRIQLPGDDIDKLLRD